MSAGNRSSGGSKRIRKGVKPRANTFQTSEQESSISGDGLELLKIFMSLKSAQRESEKSTGSSSKSSDGSSASSSSGSDEEEKIVDTLISGFYEAEDINVPGLRRSKKKPALSRKGGPAYSMEDAYATVYPLFGDAGKGLYGVFDGFAGDDASKDASRVVPEVANEVIARRGVGSDLTEHLKEIFAEADHRLEVHEFVGTTATVMLVWKHGGERYLQVANVGDSTAFLCRKGEAIPLSIDHKASSPKEHQRLRDSGIEVPDNMTRISGVAVARCLGNSFLKGEDVGIIGTPDISPPYVVGPDDKFVVIASDGLWDVISGQSACDMVSRLNNPEKMAKKLLRSATRKTKCIDNVTVLVVLL